MAYKFRKREVRKMSLLQKVLGIGTAFAIGITCLAGVPLNASAADNRYYSEMTIVAGDAGEQTLLDKSYSVFHPMLQNTSGDPYWIGYKTTSDKSAAISSLHSEANGSLSWNKNSKEPAVLSMYFMSAEQNDNSGFESVMPIPNNGAVVMPDANGNPAVLYTANGQGYLTLIKEDVWKNYIGSIAAATADSKKGAVTQLYKSGCEYYIDHNYSQDASKFTYLGYTRTSDVSQAIKDITALSGAAPEGYEKAASAIIPNRDLYITRNEKYGNPILDLEPFESGQGTELSASKLAMMIAANGDGQMTKPYILQSDAYQRLMAEGGTYLMSDVICEDGTASGLSFVSSKENLSDKQRERYAQLSLAEPGDNGSLTVQGTVEETTDSDADSDTIESDNGEAVTAAPTEAEEQTTYDNSAAGTAYADPGDAFPPLPAIIIPSVIAVLIPVVTLILRKRILKGKGDKDEKA